MTTRSVTMETGKFIQAEGKARVRASMCQSYRTLGNQSPQSDRANHIASETKAEAQGEIRLAKVSRVKLR